ncbi:hypothetical protein MBLNU459_g0636t1 [Dothideomycetes sp. NU459]
MSSSGTAPVRPGTGPYPYGTAKPTGSGFSYPSHLPPNQPSSSNSSSNSTCAGATFNVVSGSLDWWYSSAIPYGLSTFVNLYPGWTLLPATTAFNITSAFAQPTSSFYTTFNTYVNLSLVYESENTTPTPVFVRPIPTNVVLTPAPASTVLPGPVTAALTAMTDEAFVYFTEYAIDRQQSVSYRNGSRGCVTARETHTLQSPFAIYYDGPDPDGQTEVSGALPTDILEVLQVSEESVTLGSWAASPTLLVVVEEVYALKEMFALVTFSEGVPTAGATSTTEITLAVPQTTLLTPAPASSAFAATQTALQTPKSGFIPPSNVAWIAHIEVSQTSLDAATTTIPVVDVGTDSNPTVVPFVAHLGVSEITFLAPEPTGGDILSTTIDGSVVVATPLPGDGSPSAIGIQQSTTASITGLGVIVSAIEAGSGSSKSGSGGPGANDPPSAQPSPGVAPLLSAVESVARQPGATAVAAGGGNTGSSSESSPGGAPGDSSAGESSSAGSTPGGSAGSQGVSEGSSGSNVGVSLYPVAPIPISIGSIVVTVGPSSNAVIGSQTLVPGGPVITVSGTPVSLGSSAVVVGTVTHAFTSTPSQAPVPIIAGGGSVSSSPSLASVITVGGSTITQTPIPIFIVGGKSIQPGGAVTLSGTVISAASSGGAIIIGPTTVPLAIPATVVTLTTAGQTITVIPTPAYVVGGQALAAGGSAITVSGTKLSLAPSATAIVIGLLTSDLISTTSTKSLAAPPLLPIGSEVFTANAATQYLLSSGVVLTPGGVATITGTTVSLDASASEVVVNGITKTILPPILTPAPVFTLGSTVYEANAGSTYDIGGQALTPGGIITIPGTIISLASSASAIIVNGVTQKLASGTTAAAAPILTVAGRTYTANSGSSYIMDGQTLVPGGTITLSGGTILSLAPSASDIIVNGVTSTLSSMPTITAAPVLTIDGSTYTTVGGVGETYIVSGQTLTPGGSIIISGPNGPETISLTPGGTALVVAVSGATTTSILSPALGNVQTAAPVLTIGGETFTALPGAGPSYLVNGQTLTAGGAALTETISGHVYIVSLSPSATVLVVEEEGPGGQITATEYETLFPATATRGTATLTNVVSGGAGAPGGAAQTTSAGQSGGSAGPDASLQNVASTEEGVGAALACGAAIIALFAALL